jgi:hypothetical protein
LQTFVYAVPALPVFSMVTRLQVVWLTIATYAAVGFFFASVTFAILPGKPRLQSVFTALLAVTVWIPALLFLAVTARLFPAVFWMVPIALIFQLLAKGIDTTRREALIRLALPALAGLILLIARYQISPLEIGGYCLGATLFCIAVYLLMKQKALLVPAIVYLPLAAALGAYGSAAHDTYLGDHSRWSENVPSQPGLTLASTAEFPGSTDTSFFVPFAEGLVAFPRHTKTAITVSLNDKVDIAPMPGVAVDEPVVDFERDAYYFTSGQTLYRGSMRHGRLRKLASFDSGLPASELPWEPNHLRGLPDHRPERLLAVYDTCPNLLVYNIGAKASRTIATDLKLIDAVWGPRGESIVLLGQTDGAFLPKLMLRKVDRFGAVLAEQTLPFGMADLAPMDTERFMFLDFTGNAVALIDFETLETVMRIKTEAGPRAARYLPTQNAILVPSYVEGTLSTYDLQTGKRIDEWVIGKRVRGITPSLEPGRFTVSSSAGLFTIDGY